MPVFCPQTDLGLMACQYWYDGYICDNGSASETTASDIRPHNLGNCPANVCPDPIAQWSGATNAARPAIPFFPSAAKLKRPVYRQDVPCPMNPFGQPDAFWPAGPHVQVLADFEVEFDSQQTSKHYFARLILLLVAPKRKSASLMKIGIGVELDPNSPDSPSNPLHVKGNAVTVITSQGSVNALQVEPFGDTVFMVVTT